MEDPGHHLHQLGIEPLAGLGNCRRIGNLKDRRLADSGG